jgi:hypothetical protein
MTLSFSSPWAGVFFLLFIFIFIVSFLNVFSYSPFSLAGNLHRVSISIGYSATSGT